MSSDTEASRRRRSVFSTDERTLTQARRYCARQVTEGRLSMDELEDVLQTLGIDCTAKVVDIVRPQDVNFSWI